MTEPYRIAFTLAQPLPSFNAFMRTNPFARIRQRKVLAWEVAVLIPWHKRPAQPLQYARITITRCATGVQLDVDAKQCKHLLDVLQPFEKDKYPNSIGIIFVDTEERIQLVMRSQRVAHKSEQCTHVLIEALDGCAE